MSSRRKKQCIKHLFQIQGNETKQIKKKLFEYFVERFIISIEQVNLE